MDMWDAFITSTKKHAPQADIVHDKFHISKYQTFPTNYAA
jgi:transposase